jgi:hypothetical protein
MTNRPSARFMDGRSIGRWLISAVAYSALGTVDVTEFVEEPATTGAENH